MTREKLITQTSVRLAEDVIDELDRYTREREREARVPLSRAIMIREILEAWAASRARVSQEERARHETIGFMRTQGNQ